MKIEVILGVCGQPMKWHPMLDAFKSNENVSHKLGEPMENPILGVCGQPMKWHPILRCFQHPMKGAP